MHTNHWLDLALIAVITGAGVHDLAVRRIPNRLLLAGLACAALLHLLSPHPLSLLSTGLAGLATGLLLFLPLYLLRGMAAGDVKLMATVGAFTGPMLAVEIALASFIVGGLMSLVLIIAKGKGGQALANLRALLRPMFMRAIGVPLVNEPMRHASVGGMPYGLAIAAGTFAMLWFRHM
jgi:prepilin peptidase CpaA